MIQKKMKIEILIILVSSVAFVPILADAHQSGCHRWHSCPSDSGSYTCGDTGYCSQCPDNQYCKAGQPYTSYTPPKYDPPKEPLKPSPKMSDYSEPTFSTKVQFDGKNFIPSKISATNTIFLENTSESPVQITIKTYHTIGTQAFSEEISITIMPDKIKSLQMPIPITDPILSQITFISQSGSLLIVDNQGKNDYNKYLAKTPLVSDQINTSSIPSWIKNNVKWWADGSIDDKTFVSGIEYLISEGTINVPINQKTVSKTDEIPTWVKNNAKWWADGTITNSDFVKGIEFLVNSGIISVKTSQINPPSTDITTGPSEDTKYTPHYCSGSAKCISEKVTSVIDGDTLYTANYKIRLSLTNTPEKNQLGFSEATSFTAKMCPVGKMITVDQDDKQLYDAYGRLLGQVYCSGESLNSALLYNGHANILTQYCSTSEFSGENWAQKYGCKAKPVEKTPVTTPVIPKETPKDIPKETPQDSKENCDPSYPDVCIPPYPPDLDCGEIPYKNFRVVGSDPHRFDGDKDGIGCEK